MDENKRYENEFEDKSADIVNERDDINKEIDEEAGMNISIDAASISQYDECDNEADSTDGKKKYDLWKEVREWAFAIISAIIVVMLIKTFIFDCVYVSGKSMQSTLMDGDRLVLIKMGYHPQKGDIVVLDSNYEKREIYIQNKKENYGNDFSGFEEFTLRYFPWEQSTYGIEPYHYVKRVIATEGDVIDIDDITNTVYVNGTAIDEPYLDEGTLTKRKNEISFPYTVEKGHVFVMGDNRENSRDSRYASLTTVPVEAVEGKAVFRFWPLNALGTVE